MLGPIDKVFCFRTRMRRGPRNEASPIKRITGKPTVTFYKWYKNPSAGSIDSLGNRRPPRPGLTWHRRIEGVNVPSLRRAAGTWLPGSARNSVVHSLSVTLSNHTILGNPSYNDPCPKDHPSYDRQTWPIGWPTRRSSFPRKMFFWREVDRSWSQQAYGVRFWFQQTESSQCCGEVRPAGQTAKCHR